MENKEDLKFRDVVFLYGLGIPPEKIAKAKKISVDDVNKLINSQQDVVKKNKINIVQEIANQNPWKDEVPPDEILELMAEHLEAEDRHDGARTIPSRPIPKADRSERLGEDREMVDRVEGVKAASSAPKVLREVVEAATIAKRRRDRDDWEEVRTGVSDLLDDDLDL
ncbi:MAG: hypothetical protein QGI21_04870 [Candidatus Poseidoniaceae archaeon]|jgi:hypothetical protein|nr:hypothetical protein [Candidatus Poseidoniaceae archaeon]